MKNVKCTFSIGWLRRELIKDYGLNFSTNAVAEIHVEAIHVLESSLEAGRRISVKEAVDIACSSLGYMLMD